ncbi:hypothetical protein ACDI10_16610 [Vreelandella venusta]|uniref:hypothetical protein n=1 Tax=Vreelandella venusta TaxID=44935 RepID=UPI0035561CC4
MNSKKSFIREFFSSVGWSILALSALASLGLYGAIQWLLKQAEWGLYLSTTLLVVLVFTAMIFIKLSYHFYGLLGKGTYTPPDVIKGYTKKKPDGNVKQVCLLLHKHPMFQFDVLVSIYVVDNDGHEELVAIGRVENVQTNNGFIHVSVEYHTNFKDLSLIIDNNASYLRQIVVKPVITERSIGDVINE